MSPRCTNRARTKEAIETQRLALLLRAGEAELQKQMRRMKTTRDPR